MKIKLIVFFVVFILLVTGGYFGYQKYQEYIHSNPYLLSKLGYTEKEIEKIEKLKNVKHILEIEYEPKLVEIIKQKYFIEKNLDRYLAYYKENQDKKIEDIISIININADKEPYSYVKKADVEKGILMLVNKHNQLNEDFVFEDIQDISLKYAYDDNKISKQVLDAYIEMWNAAKEDGITLIVTSGYRDYKSQETVYNSYVRKGGEAYANTYAAKPGFSEHQTGLSLDIFGYGTTKENFESSDSFKWLSNHAHEYGFILRYPKDKEFLTGYDYESWHYRYVGKEDAKKIHDEGITFDEYYAYYIENGD